MKLQQQLNLKMKKELQMTNINIFDGPVQNITKLVAFQQKIEWHTMFFAKIRMTVMAHI